MTRVHGVQPGESLRAEHFLLLVAGGDGERCKAGQGLDAHRWLLRWKQPHTRDGSGVSGSRRRPG